MQTSVVLATPVRGNIIIGRNDVTGNGIHSDNQKMAITIRQYAVHWCG